MSAHRVGFLASTILESGLRVLAFKNCRVNIVLTSIKDALV